MSPSWHNRLFIAISPEHISMIKLGRGLKPKVQATYDEAITPVGKQPYWQAAVERLSQLLSLPEWQKAEVSVVLSNRFTRFSTITFSAQLNNYAAQEAFTRHALMQTYGAMAEHWALRIQHGKKGAPSLVSAVEQALLEELRQICAAHQLKLNLITPYLTPVFNRFQKALKKDPAWLVIHEPGYSLLALMAGAEFVAINGVCHSGLDELPVLLDRENLTNALSKPCKSVYLFSPSEKWSVAVPKLGYEFYTLELAIREGFPDSSNGLNSLIMSEFL